MKVMSARSKGFSRCVGATFSANLLVRRDRPRIAGAGQDRPMNDFQMSHLAADRQRDLLAEAQRQRRARDEAGHSHSPFKRLRSFRPRPALRPMLGSVLGRQA